MNKIFGHMIIPTVLILVFPLLGVLIDGQSVLPYLVFPPEPVVTSHGAFSLPVFLAFLLLILAATLPFLKVGLVHTGKKSVAAAGPFPWWGVVSFSGLACFWIMAWTRFDGFARFQPHTFFPVWICWIVSVNALVHRSQNQCPLLASPLKFLRLFIVSALFWWVFEYLNRFVGNWYYSASQYRPWRYFLLATLSFSTVLPAVETTKAYLLTFDRFKNGFAHCRPVPYLNSKPFAICLMICSCVCLCLMAMFPDALFPLVWVCPLLVLLGYRILFSRRHILYGVVSGDFTMVVAYASAALVCGFFWEMFNMYSLARWQYTIPYVDVLHLFEMPLLGYAGYLPFGLECAVVIGIAMEP
jgi:hypothetical protein